MNDNVFRASAWADIIIGIGGFTVTLLYDVLMGRNWSLGFWSILTLVVCVVFVIKGKKLLDLVD